MIKGYEITKDSKYHFVLGLMDDYLYWDHTQLGDLRIIIYVIKTQLTLDFRILELKMRDLFAGCMMWLITFLFGSHKNEEELGKWLSSLKDDKEKLEND